MGNSLERHLAKEIQQKESALKISFCKDTVKKISDLTKDTLSNAPTEIVNIAEEMKDRLNYFIRSTGKSYEESETNGENVYNFLQLERNIHRASRPEQSEENLIAALEKRQQKNKRKGRIYRNEFHIPYEMTTKF